MPTQLAHQLGGKARGAQERNAALNTYYINPNKCQTCGLIIYVKPTERVCETRKKKFCSHSCSAKVSNLKRHQKMKTKCLACESPIRANKRYCNKTCFLSKKIPSFDGITKGDLFKRTKNYQSARSSIRGHAAKIFFKNYPNPQCICGYNKHIDVAHRKSVKSFPSTALITEINDPTNLIGLCPNCHWEFDHDLLQIGCGSGSRTPVS